MNLFSHRWYGALIGASILAGIAGATYMLKSAYSQSVNVSGPLSLSPNGPGGIAAGYPAGARPNYGFGSGSGSFFTVSMTPAPNRLIYMCGWSITGGGAAARVGPIVVQGLGNEFDYDGSVTVDGGTIAQDKYLPYCIPAFDSSTTPSISVANVIGGANISVQMYGFDVPIN